MFCLLVITLVLALAQNTEAMEGFSAVALKAAYDIDLAVAQELVLNFDMNGDGRLSLSEMNAKFMTIVEVLKEADKSGIEIDILGLKALINLDLNDILNLDVSGILNLGGSGVSNLGGLLDLSSISGVTGLLSGLGGLGGLVGKK